MAKIIPTSCQYGAGNTYEDGETVLQFLQQVASSGMFLGVLKQLPSSPTSEPHRHKNRDCLHGHNSAITKGYFHQLRIVRMWSPHETLLGGYGTNDGTIDFYSRINTLASPSATLLDLGAGRGEWYEDDTVAFRKSLRLMKGKFAAVIATDVDPAVLQNRTADHTELIRDGLLPVADGQVDVVVCDYVLEHIDDVALFVSEVARVLKPGGWFCARTPHRYNYVALASQMVGERNEQSLLARAQPKRKEIDVFKKHYLINTMTAIRRAFQGWEDHSFIYRTEPAYFFGSRRVFGLQSFLHRTLPAAVSGNIFAFLQKPEVP